MADLHCTYSLASNLSNFFAKFRPEYLAKPSAISVILVKQTPGFEIFKLSLSFDHTIETVIHVDQQENQNYCYEIAKL